MKKRVKVVVIPILTLIVAATQLSGCSSSSKSQVIDTVNEVGGDTIVEFKIEENEFTEQGELQQIEWVKLSTLNTYPEYRTIFEVNMGIGVGSGIKSGCIYVDADGNHTDNPTLLSAFSNKVVVEKFNNDEVQNYLRSSIQSTYADLEDSDEYAAIINAYFNLLPDSTPNYFNSGKSLSRLEAMTLVTRATTPVSTLTPDQAFTEAVGDTPYTSYASLSNTQSFISTSDNSLTQDNATKAMSRGEYIYLIMATIYGDDTITAVELTKSKLTDIKETTPTEHTKTNTEQLALALQTPTQAPEQIYKALVLANDNNILPANTDWNRAITKGKAIEFIVEAIQAYNEKNGYAIDKDTAIKTAEDIYKEDAKKAYADNKDELGCTEDKYIEHIMNKIKDGLTIEEAIRHANEVLAKEQPTVNEEEVASIAAEIDKETSGDTTPEPTTQSPVNNNNNSGGNSGNNNSGGGNTNNGGGNTSGGSNNSGGGTPTYVEPPQQQQQTPQEPVYTPPVETPPANNGSGSGDPFDNSGFGGEVDYNSGEHLNWQD